MLLKQEFIAILSTAICHCMQVVCINHPTLCLSLSAQVTGIITRVNLASFREESHKGKVKMERLEMMAD